MIRLRKERNGNYSFSTGFRSRSDLIEKYIILVSITSREVAMSENRTIKEAIRRKYPSIDLNDSLATAMSTMAGKNASALVVKSGEELIGIVTITDVIYCLANDQDPETTDIASFMTKCELISEAGTANPCAQLDEEQEAMSALKVMHEAGVNHLIVSGANGEPAGIVSSLDLVKLLAS